MKKNALTNAVIAGIAGVAGIASVANAVNLNPDGLGQVLIYPYYTVNGGNNTLVSIVNTTEFGKAVKVRFVEGRNSREVLDFNLYLSQYDVWTGAVYALSDTGPAVLSTADTSCTVPNIRTNQTLPINPANGLRYVAFRNFQYVTVPGVIANNDAGPNGLDRTREGHLEVIEMAIVTNDIEGSLDAITHSNGVPNNCPQVVTAWTASSTAADYWNDSNGTIDTIAPTTANGGGGLFGGAALVDFANGTQLTYVADAIDGFSVRNLHFAPGLTSPSLSDARFPTIAGAEATVFDNGALIQTEHTTANAIDAVSAVYMHDAIFNEYAVLADSTNTPILASEWVVTFPTKRFYVDRPAPAIVPFQNVFATYAPQSGDGPGKAPVDIRLAVYNREENDGFSDCLDGGEDACVDFSPTLPGTVTTPQLFWEAQVVTFNQPSSFDATNAITGSTLVLGSKLAANVDVGQFGFTEGWMKMRFWDTTAAPLNLHLSRADTSGDRYTGMPVTGFWAENTQTTSVLANFAGIWRHKGSRCVVPSGQVAATVCPSAPVGP